MTGCKCRSLRQRTEFACSNRSIYAVLFTRMNAFQMFAFVLCVLCCAFYKNERFPNVCVCAAVLFMMSYVLALNTHPGRVVVFVVLVQFLV